MHLEKFEIEYSSLSIKEESIAFAMGYPAELIPDEIISQIHSALKDAEPLFDIHGGYRIISPVKFLQETHQIVIDNSILDINVTVYHQIKKSQSAALFLCTAGPKITEHSKRLLHGADVIKGYIYDVLGSVVVEAAMDVVQNRLKEKMLEEGLNITNRYSPGYCEWDVSEQNKLFSLLPKDFCGITLTDTCLMQPIKSVSGIMGIGKEVMYNPYTCNLCSMENCLYKNLHRKKA